MSQKQFGCLQTKWDTDKGTITNVDDDPMDDASDVYDHEEEEEGLLATLPWHLKICETHM